MTNTIRSLLLAASVCALMSGTPAFAAHVYAADGGLTATTSTTTTATRLTATDIRGIQVALQNQNLFDGSVDGRWGPHTQAALSSFQSAHNLDADGLPTAATLALLGVTPANAPTVVDANASDIDTSQPRSIEPAAGGDVVYLETTSMTTTPGYEVTDSPRTNTKSENGSTCLKCTNGPIGNGGTHSMRANEY